MVSFAEARYRVPPGSVMAKENVPAGAVRTADDDETVAIGVLDAVPVSDPVMEDVMDAVIDAVIVDDGVWLGVIDAVGVWLGVDVWDAVLDGEAVTDAVALLLDVTVEDGVTVGDVDGDGPV